MTFFRSGCPRGVPAAALAACAALSVPLLVPLPASAQIGAAVPDAPMLDPVVVTANRVPEPRSTVLGDLSVIDRAQIDRAGASGVADLLARLPGIEFARNGGPGTTTSVFVRGSESRHTAVYVDGVRVDSQATGGAPWEQIPLDQIDRIEVLRGPAAAVYGSDAVAGVIQLFTKRGDGPARPDVALTVGSYRTREARVGVSGAADGLDYALSAAHGRSRGYDARTDLAANHNPDADGWRRTSGSARLGYQFDPVHRVDASVLASRLKAGYDGFGATVDDQAENRLRTLRLGWQGRWSEQSTTRLQVGESRTTYESQPSFYRTETRLRDATLQHEQRIDASMLVTGTLERRDDRLDNAATAFGGALGGRRHQDALGLGWRGDFGAHGVQVHVRRDRDSEFGGKTTGSLAWGWTFAPQWRLTASAANSFRAPTLYQRFSEYGNPALVPENGRNLEAGLRWSADGSEASLVAWRNRVSDLIGFGSPGICASTFGCYVNVGRAQLKGITLAGRTDLGTVALRGSIDFHDPRNLDTDTVLQRRARRLATLGADARLVGWTVGAEVQAAGRRYEDAANAQPLGGYALVNLVASVPLGTGLTLEARLDNLADKQYELARSYATAGRNGQVTLRWTGI